MPSINLIPSSIRKAQARRARLIRWTLSLSISALLAAIPYSITLSREAQAAVAQQQLEAFEQQAASLRSTLRGETARTQEALSEWDRSRALRAKRSWSALIALVARCLPDECWLGSLATDPEAPPAAPPRPAPQAGRFPGPLAGDPAPATVVIEAPQKLRLTGYSTGDAPPLVLVRRLMESRVFSRVGLEKTTRAPAASGATEELLYQFEIVCEW